MQTEGRVGGQEGCAPPAPDLIDYPSGFLASLPIGRHALSCEQKN